MLRARKSRPVESLDFSALEPQHPEGSHIDPPSQEESPEDYALRRELGRTFQEGLQALPEQQRKVVLLMDVQGLSYEEAAQAMGYSLGTVIPNPPKDTDGRREDSGRGWVRELQGRWPGVLG